MWLNGPALGSPATTATLQRISPDNGGAKQTMQAMRQFVRDAIRDPSQQIRETALGIIAGAAGYTDQVARLQRWVQTNIQYVRDPPDVELVQTPKTTLDYRAGDCDDQATLMAALLMATGHPAQFIAVGQQGGALSHVLTQTLIGNQWVAAETIAPKPLGWMPSGITAHYILKV